MALVFPGTEIPIPSSSKSVTFGPGIAAATVRDSASDTNDSEPRYVSTRAGILTSAKGKDRGESFWVEGVSKRYVPAQRDIVLGTIVARHAEGYRVDLGGAHMAALDALAFEAATKRSKPNLKVSVHAIYVLGLVSWCLGWVC
jgi:exosome complex component RRP40